MRKSWDIPIIVIYVVVLLVIVNGFVVQPAIDKVRNDAKHVENRLELTPAEFIGVGLMGGSRGMAVSYLWAKAVRLEFEHDYYEIQSLIDLITKLQPNFPTVWEFNGWLLAYNVAVDWRAREDRWEWIKAGIDVVKEGLAKNEGSVVLEFYLGWLYYHKVSSETGDRDYYWIGSLPAGTRMTFDLDEIPSGQDYDLYLRECAVGDMTCPGAAFSRSLGAVPEHIEYVAKDGKLYCIEVYPNQPVIVNYCYWYRIRYY